VSPGSRALHTRRLVAKYTRWLHIYGSMASFAVVFFFAVTGLTLNHPQWFASAQRTTALKGTLDAAWVAPAADPTAKKFDIVEHLRAAHHLTGAVADFRADDREVDVTFKGPGYSADVFIDRATGAYDVTENRMGLVAVLNDLHKGRDSGTPWRWLIDVSAILLVFVSLTGLVLLWFIHKHRLAGAMALVAGGVLTWLVWQVWVE
jgi:hypothetical protein